ncbi:histidinol dehydrogenase [Haloferax volcanii]|uniref:Histidinol dehydrogenase n=3 Tax=Haloferax volcanii TaxID=2246 RepID=A0A384LLS3_HALVD|nr:histidinol dehydrogenase [Haloferax volcanii]ADE04402.1 histidinol dehydrogenase [Haloferax volcanii DS2]ELY32269.1 bifunctional histidinal dehydrogenase/ histidinol dehydrogenase [Haloferax volcanii DS2]MBS8118435.1 histidinol dehydrogenase [Haloferax volcanii]MBS8123448.1 histidinol dehydrogenase [Haloferax volcanii]MBS8127316.1 histidinol dehydrogenase [Haloferax volcanii]
MNIEVRELADLGTDARRAFFERDAGVGEVQSDVRDIVERVRREGDVAVREFSNEFDGVQVGNIDVTDAAERAYDEIDDDVREAIEAAAANVREFHEKQVPEDWHEEFGDVGTRELGRRYRPLDRVGVYAPGGTAAYPSSVLMGVIPAKVAGVEHVAVATPPAEPMNPVTLAAMHVAGADAVYSVGGAQGIAALAYGTETVKAVQKVVGPGNKWVTAAKAEVRGDVDIDFLAGPSEVLVVADETAEARFVAADLVAQAEHDPNASVVAVTDDADLAAEVVAEVERQAGERERAETIEAALEGDASGVLLARSMSEAVLFAEEYAAEHLTIQADDDEALLDRIDSAGSVFLGPYTPVAAGDYASGTNHVLPTGGGAKRQGGLSVDHFVRSTTVQRLDRDGLSELSETITTLAEAEGLDAHAQSVRERFEE